MGSSRILANCRLEALQKSDDSIHTRNVFFCKFEWNHRLHERPDVTCWAYTRSWRVPSLLPFLEDLRMLLNVQLFASMDKSHTDMPPKGWRRAWIDGDSRAGTPQQVQAHMDDPVTHNLVTFDGAPSYVCPEETGRKNNCAECQYCFARGGSKDVTFLLHEG